MDIGLVSNGEFPLHWHLISIKLKITGMTKARIAWGESSSNSFCGQKFLVGIWLTTWKECCPCGKEYRLRRVVREKLGVEELAMGFQLERKKRGFGFMKESEEVCTEDVVTNIDLGYL